MLDGQTLSAGCVIHGSAVDKCGGAVGHSAPHSWRCVVAAPPGRLPSTARLTVHCDIRSPTSTPQYAMNASWHAWSRTQWIAEASRAVDSH